VDEDDIIAFVKTFMEGSDDDRLVPDDLAEASPSAMLARVSPQAPPLLAAHGNRSWLVPPSEGISLHHALGRAGVGCRLELLAGAGHEDAEFDSPAMLATTAAWLRAVLA
jgi:acetyl esterase/lipase